MNNALLFINGEKPKKIPKDLAPYSLVACTDGAYTQYVIDLNINLDFISGDLDSINPDRVPPCISIIYTPDQNKTDFHKALEILVEKGIKKVDVYGATGKESDHFIGNLATALFFKNKLKISFYDDYSKFFFSDKHIELYHVKDKIISLIPFFEAKNIVTKGLKYALNKESLSFPERIGTRNIAEEDTVSISYSEGELLIYVGL